MTSEPAAIAEINPVRATSNLRMKDSLKRHGGASIISREMIPAHHRITIML
jgi:hypothetical protein